MGVQTFGWKFILVVLAFPTSACSSKKLTKEKAAELIEASYANRADQGNSCTLKNVDRSRPTALSMPEFDNLTRGCLAQLAKAKMITKGVCVDPAQFGGCYKWEVAAGPSAKQTERGQITFECGTFKLLEVESVTTKDAKASVTFRREFIPNEAVLTAIESCQVDVPERGRLSRTWDFERDDDGAWRIAK